MNFLDFFSLYYEIAALELQTGPDYSFEGPYTQFQRGLYIHGVGKLAIFDGNRRLSLKRCKIGEVTMQNIFSLFS